MTIQVKIKLSNNLLNKIKMNVQTIPDMRLAIHEKSCSIEDQEGVIVSEPRLDKSDK